MKANLTVTVRGDCSTPMDVVMEALETAFEELGFQVKVKVPDPFPDAWDGLAADETVLIKYDSDEE